MTVIWEQDVAMITAQLVDNAGQVTEARARASAAGMIRAEEMNSAEGMKSADGALSSSTCPNPYSNAAYEPQNPPNPDPETTSRA